MSDQEKKDKKIGIAVSAGLHVLLLLLFFFIMAWRAPDPPLPEYGIELNFGMDDAGFGEEQPQTPASESPVEEMERVQPEQTQPQEVQEVIEEPAVQPQPAVEEPVETVEEVVTQPQPSPVSREEVKKEEAQPEPVKEKTQEPKKEAAKPALFPSDNKEAQAAEANQGDREGAVGDQGDEQGTLDSRALYGEQGGGAGGAQLNISGWRWDEAPDQRDQSKENGRIIFRFKIDDQGYVIEASTLETTVSPKVTQFYREQLLRTTFSPTSGNAVPASTTAGTVTFVIKAR